MELGSLVTFALDRDLYGIINARTEYLDGSVSYDVVVMVNMERRIYTVTEGEIHEAKN